MDRGTSTGDSESVDHDSAHRPSGDRETSGGRSSHRDGPASAPRRKEERVLLAELVRRMVPEPGTECGNDEIGTRCKDGEGMAGLLAEIPDGDDKAGKQQDP